jgi:tRNA modification GTPase
MATPVNSPLRAVANGKLDLMQAEAIHEFVQAQTEQQARTQLRQIEGVASKRVAPIQGGSVDLIAHLEAGIDFAEDDRRCLAEGKSSIRNWNRYLKRLTSVAERRLNTAGLLVEGLRVTIVGKPNVGKSSLLIVCCRTDRAIVTEIPGTTRDVLTEPISVNGVPCGYRIPQGFRETQDRVKPSESRKSLEMMSGFGCDDCCSRWFKPIADEDEDSAKSSNASARRGNTGRPRACIRD